MTTRTAGALCALLLCAPMGAAGLTLETALARTVEKNPAIRQAKARLEEAAGRRIVLRAPSLPNAGIGIFGGLQGGKRAGEDQTQPFAFGQGLLTQPLFYAGIPAMYRRGNIEVLLAQQRLNMALTEQLHTARVAFYTAAYNDSLQALAETQRQRLATNAATQSDRYQAGTADRAAVTVARLLEYDVKPRVEQSRRLGSGALLKLAETMGEDLGPGGQLPRVDGGLQFAPVHVNADTETSRAVAERPDLQIARLLVRAAEEDQRIIEAAYYPAINATISGTYIPVSEIRRGSEGSARRSDDIISSEARAGAAYTWRVVDNGRVRGAATRQRAVREINELVLARLEANVPRELTRIQNSLRALQARHDALTKASSVAQLAVTDVQNSLAEGLSSQLEYRTAESSFLESTAGVLTVAFEQQIALAEWDRATGRYLQFFNEPSG
ncbi:MAG: TolC family protein [Chthoniobacterales bacterium]|nr:TolC family protein [Chthoniobacterales bacterium]